MKRTTIFFILTFLLILSLLTGCKEKECKIDNDCDIGNSCVAARCYKGTCERQLLDNCCDENVCTGKVTFPDPRYSKRTLTADYAEKYCEENTCIVGVQETKPLQLFSEHSGAVSFELVSSVEQPYVLEKGSLSLTITLTDYVVQLAQLPIIIDNVQVLTGSELIGQQTLNATLTTIGDVATTTLTVNPTTEELEEEIYVRLRVTYHYQQPPRAGVNSTERNSFEATYNKQLIFINPEKVTV